MIHRADYHQVLMDKARDLGVKVRLGAKVDYVDFETGQTHLEKGEVILSDVIIGADGMWSQVSFQIFQLVLEI